MNLKNILLILSLGLLLFGCKNEVKEAEEPLFDKKKIADAFNKNPNEVLFNHLYVVLDSSTYAQLRANKFLNESYAGLDRGMPLFEKINDTVSSIYLRGEAHYLEILGPNNSFKEPVGQTGLGFSLGGQQSFSLNNSPKLKEEGTKFLQGMDTASFSIKNEEQIWYKAFYTVGMKTNLYTWYSYYNPVFLEALDGEKRNNYTREDFLKHAYSPEKLFKNVVSIAFKLQPGGPLPYRKRIALIRLYTGKKRGGRPYF